MAGTNPSSSRLLVGMALLSLAAVAAALVAQHAFDIQPCPWCILQRVVFIAIALVCGVGALVSSRGVRAGSAGLALVLALCGVAAALWQHFVAAKSASCNLTLADRIIGSLGLEALAPALFQVTASCADAVSTIVGVPFEFWSLALYVFLALAAIAVLRGRR
jgi:disulfide bond formation protein DsbB